MTQWTIVSLNAAEQYNPNTHKGSLPISKFFCIAFSCIYLCARDAHGSWRFSILFSASVFCLLFLQLSVCTATSAQARSDDGLSQA